MGRSEKGKIPAAFALNGRLDGFSVRLVRPIFPVVEPTRRPADRKLTRQDLPGILTGLGVIFAFFGLAAAGHPLLGAAVMGGAMWIAFRSMPREQREAMGREIERRERTPFGRFMKIGEILLALALLYLIVRTLFTRP